MAELPSDLLFRVLLFLVYWAMLMFIAVEFAAIAIGLYLAGRDLAASLAALREKHSHP